jgi:hypothetical protein
LKIKLEEFTEILEDKITVFTFSMSHQ